MKTWSPDYKQQTKVTHWDNESNKIITKHIKSGDSWPTDDAKESIISTVSLSVSNASLLVYNKHISITPANVFTKVHVINFTHVCVRVCARMLHPVLNRRHILLGAEVPCRGTDVDVLMDQDGVIQT